MKRLGLFFLLVSGCGLSGPESTVCTHCDATASGGDTGGASSASSGASTSVSAASGSASASSSSSTTAASSASSSSSVAGTGGGASAASTTGSGGSGGAGGATGAGGAGATGSGGCCATGGGGGASVSTGQGGATSVASATAGTGGGPSSTTTTASSSSSGGGCTADTSSDPDNCGACGHSCLGSTCSAGLCDPTRIPNTIQASSIGVSGAAVAWGSDTGQLEAADLDGLNVRSMPSGSGFTSVAGSPSHLAIGFSGGASEAIFVYDASGATLEINEPTTAPSALVFDGDTDVYFARSASFVSRFDLLTLTESDVGHTTSATVSGVDAADGLVFWSGDSGIWSAPASSSSTGPGALVASGEMLPRTVAAGAGNVYWLSDVSTETLVRATDEAGAGQAVTVRQSLPVVSFGLAADTSDVYWMRQGVLERRPLAGGAVEAVASQPNGVMLRAAVGSDRIYWVSHYNVFWVAK